VNYAASQVASATARRILGEPVQDISGIPY